MFFGTRKKPDGPTQSQIDYAKELYRMFHGRELKKSELTKENIDRIISEYSNKLHSVINE
ncbi:hypothetical protein OXPF_12800 [Oxobacter pfennigii]|uniref:Uncharacterized protein n=1 Tax=Oxobacter pfennigii TaxID=36849 RepID=A0A0P9AI66_9CLOT|nr:hypothetical protein [Oxobacter pfennigii]KPU45153.1 hypothetical protein OXPF_12800 [Oxobacter pfennigii]